MTNRALQAWCAPLVAATLSVLASTNALADTQWSWSYTASGIAASGTLTTADTPDASGFYQILSITGSRNGVAITGLYPNGQAIPGNEPYTVDNLIKPGPQGQFTTHGLGFSLASGAYVNPFYADFLTPAVYLEVFTHGGVYSELPVAFHAAPVPEASTAALVVAGLIAMTLRRREQRA